MIQAPVKIGLIARCDNTGLGNQTWEFYKHIHCEKTMVVDISMFNNNMQYPERFPGATFISGFPTEGDIRTFLDGIDVVFTAETPYNYQLFSIAREMGVKTIQQYNYEFLDYWEYPENPLPDLLLAPSKWHYEDVQRLADERGVKHTYLHCPVNRELLPFRKIQKFDTFLHIAGKTAAKDRNGTKTVIEASRLIKSEANIIIHFQGEQGLAHQSTYDLDYYYKYINEHGGKNLEVIKQDFDNYQDIYSLGDVLVLPRRYGGNCLQLNEALSCGMPVLMPNVSPNNQFLPIEWLMPANEIEQFTPRTTVTVYDVNPQTLANKIDYFYNMDNNQAYYENLTASKIAQSINWKGMDTEYIKVIDALCKNQL